MASVELQHRPNEQQQNGESHSPFLTDRESASLTATVMMGPLALAAFDTHPEAPRHYAPTPETPDTLPDTIDGFDTAELLTVMRRQQNVARAAIVFADQSLN